jgi:type I restriction enzyme R subunit
VGTSYIQPVAKFLEINEDTVKFIAGKKDGEGTKVINLVKSIEKTAEENSEDPFLIAMAERARAVQEGYEDRQTSTREALDALFAEIDKNEKRKKEQAQKGFDGLTFFVYRTLLDEGVSGAEEVSGQIKAAFAEHPNWQTSEAELRELRNEVTFTIYAKMDDLDQVARIVDNLFSLLAKAYKIK